MVKWNTASFAIGAVILCLCLKFPGVNSAIGITLLPSTIDDRAYNAKDLVITVNVTDTDLEKHFIRIACDQGLVRIGCQSLQIPYLNFSFSEMSTANSRFLITLDITKMSFQKLGTSVLAVELVCNISCKDGPPQLIDTASGRLDVPRILKPTTLRAYLVVKFDSLWLNVTGTRNPVTPIEANGRIIVRHQTHNITEAFDSTCPPTFSSYALQRSILIKDFNRPGWIVARFRVQYNHTITSPYRSYNFTLYPILVQSAPTTIDEYLSSKVLLIRGIVPTGSLQTHVNVSCHQFVPMKECSRFENRTYSLNGSTDSLFKIVYDFANLTFRPRTDSRLRIATLCKDNSLCQGNQNEAVREKWIFLTIRTPLKPQKLLVDVTDDSDTFSLRPNWVPNPLTECDGFFLELWRMDDQSSVIEEMIKPDAKETTWMKNSFGGGIVRGGQYRCSIRAQINTTNDGNFRSNGTTYDFYLKHFTAKVSPNIIDETLGDTSLTIQGLVRDSAVQTHVRVSCREFHESVQSVCPKFPDKKMELDGSTFLMDFSQEMITFRVKSDTRLVIETLCDDNSLCGENQGEVVDTIFLPLRIRAPLKPSEFKARLTYKAQYVTVTFSWIPTEVTMADRYAIQLSKRDRKFSFLMFATSGKAREVKLERSIFLTNETGAYDVTITAESFVGNEYYWSAQASTTFQVYSSEQRTTTKSPGPSSNSTLAALVATGQCLVAVAIVMIAFFLVKNRQNKVI